MPSQPASRLLLSFISSSLRRASDLARVTLKIKLRQAVPRVPWGCRQPARQGELTTGVIFKAGQMASLDSKNKMGTMFFICSVIEEAGMLKVFVEEAAALASIALFVGMIAVWAQLIPQL